MSIEPQDLDRLGDQLIDNTATTTPSMAWVTERSAQLRHRRRIVVATIAAPVVVLVGLVGWLTVGQDGGPQSIESVDRPEDGTTIGGDGTDNEGTPDSQGGSPTVEAVQTIAVPNVVGLTDEKAFELLDEVGLEVEWDWVSEIDGEPVSAGQVIRTAPEAGAQVDAGDTVTLYFYRPEQELFSDYNDPGLQAQDLYPLVLDPADLGPGWGEFFLEKTSEAVLVDPVANPDLADCAGMGPVVVRDGFIAEYGFEDSPDDAFFVVSTGTPAEVQSFYDNFQLLTACEGSGPLERVVTPRPTPDLPGVLDATLSTTSDNLNQRSDVLLIHHPDFVYMLDIGIKDGAEPFDIVALATELLMAYEASR